MAPSALLPPLLLCVLFSISDGFMLSAPSSHFLRSPVSPLVKVGRPFASQCGLRTPSRSLRNGPLMSMDSLVEEVDAESLELAVADSSEPLIVDFFTTWCGPCRLLEPQLKMAAIDLKDRVKFLKLDTDKNPDLATAMKIYALPTVLFIKDGEILQKSEGALTATKINEIAEYCFFDGEKPLGLDDPDTTAQTATEWE